MVLVKTMIILMMILMIDNNDIIIIIIMRISIAATTFRWLSEWLVG